MHNFQRGSFGSIRLKIKQWPTEKLRIFLIKHLAKGLKKILILISGSVP